MQIALPSADGIHIDGHAGQARRWAIYDCQPGTPIGEPRFVELERPQLFHHWQETTSLAAHPLAGTEAIITGSAGANFVERMQKRGVHVVQTGETQVVDAIEKFLAGEALRDPRWEPLLMLCRLRDRLLGH